MATFMFWFITILQLTKIAIATKKTYIVHMKHQDKPLSYATHHDWYTSSLSSSSLLYIYDTAYHGFSASLDPNQVSELLNSDSVLGVYEDSIYTLHTTRTPQFLGLQETVFPGHFPNDLNRKSQDVIIGVLDTGVYPESKSFSDLGMSKIPARWKGGCEPGPDFGPGSCNKKLIGAKSFSKGYHMSIADLKKPKEVASARDRDGHGTHTASTAAGGHVSNASLFGYATGTARGMAVHARVAVYKVCWSTGCFGSDILAAMEEAIKDGVDVLSVSLGGGSQPYYRDTIAIGAFTAVERGIFVSCSAGNSGPAKASLTNVAPWLMTVGAGTIDRDFPAYALLGNKKRLTGVSLYSGKPLGAEPVQLIYTKANINNNADNMCLPGSLQPSLVRGKVVVCDRGINTRAEKGAVVAAAGGVGMILANTVANGEELVADSHLLPTVAIGQKLGGMIREYVRSDKNPTVVISFGGTVLNVRPSPVVAAFSSRGPNILTPEILKPDVIGPGVNILAAWSDGVGPTGMERDTRRTQFNIISGTSMSCPHISGLAALLKAANPHWSPSAIKSALITTSYTQDSTKYPLRDAADGSLSTPFAHGAGHVAPHKALSPGLVYDISTQDYIAFLCSLDYTLGQVKAIVKHPNTTCSRKFANPGQLNYPSFSVLFAGSRVVRYTRVLTNVGLAGSVYWVSVTGPTMVDVMVKPRKLVFINVGDKQRYTVTFVAKKGTSLMAKTAFGSLVWSNDQHQVTSPIAFAWTQLRD